MTDIDNQILSIVEDGMNTSYIDSLLIALFYKHNNNILTELDKKPQKSCGIYLQELIKEKFIEQAKKVYIGEPFGDGCNDCTIAIGPVISLEQKERINKYVDMIKKEQNDILILGDELNGCFISPTVFQSEWKDKSYLKEEIFGPVVAIVPFDLIDDAIRIYNDTDYGLAVGICTNNYRIMRKMRDECDAGMIYFNLGSIGAESSLPFGGVKMSGYGHGSAAATFDAVVHQVAVTYNHAEIVTFPQGLK